MVIRKGYFGSRIQAKSAALHLNLMLCLFYAWPVHHSLPPHPYMLQLGQRRFRGGVALRPLLLNDRLLFISLEKERGRSPKNPKPLLWGLDGSHLSLLQIAVCPHRFVWLRCLTANESIFLRLEQVGCGSSSSQETGPSRLPICLL